MKRSKVTDYAALMIRTIKTKLHLSPISLHSASSVRIPSSVNNFRDMSILNHLMHSKDAEYILMFLSAMPRGVSVAHIYVLKLPLHHP